MPDPAISVIIPVWNGEATIGGTLAALKAQTFPAGDFEIIVVDNGSTDGTAAIIAGFQGVTLLHEPVASSYRARNLGLSVAKGTYIALTDADCVPHADWLATLMRAARERPEVDLFGGRITLFKDREGGQAYANYEVLYAFNQENNIANGKCITANWFCRRALLKEMGGFNANLKSGGDVDLSSRISRAGHRLLYVPEASVGHPFRASYAELAQKQRRVVGGRWQAQLGSRSVPNFLGVYLLEAAVRTKSILKSGHGFGQKLLMLGIVARLFVTSIAELLRVSRGGEPTRS